MIPSTPPRTMLLPGVPNCRDLGGWKTADGLTVRFGRVYRSSQLCGAQESALAALRSLGLHTVYDLRGPHEVEKYPDPALEGVLILPLLPPDHPTPAGRGMLRAGEIRGRGKPGEGVLALYRSYPQEFAPAFSRILRDLAAGRGPVLFHCRNGKDRAGVLSATLLRALGVREEDILTDYLNTNVSYACKNEEDYARIGQGMDEEELAILRSFFEARPEYLAAYWKAVETLSGSFEGYLAGPLGLDGETLGALRSHLLE